MQKFYLHEATTTVGGTLPGASTLSATTPNVTATGAATNRTMDGTIGSSQASGALATLANTSPQRNWFRRYISPQLAAQTIAAGANFSWDWRLGMQQANAASAFKICGGYLAVWRPSTGAIVGVIFDNMGSLTPAPTTTVEEAIDVAAPDSSGAAAVTVQDGDVLVYEVWGGNIQTKSTSYTNTVYYNGTTENSATSNAAFIMAPADIAMFSGAAPAARPKQRVVNQAVMRAVTRCQKLTRRRSGLFVPAHWAERIVVAN